jgi:hypothetical protein
MGSAGEDRTLCAGEDRARTAGDLSSNRSTGSREAALFRAGHCPAPGACACQLRLAAIGRSICAPGGPRP